MPTGLRFCSGERNTEAPRMAARSSRTRCSRGQTRRSVTHQGPDHMGLRTVPFLKEMKQEGRGQGTTFKRMTWS